MAIYKYKKLEIEDRIKWLKIRSAYSETTMDYKSRIEESYRKLEKLKVGGWMDGWMDGWVDGWVDGWMGGWMDGWKCC